MRLSEWSWVCPFRKHILYLSKINHLGCNKSYIPYRSLYKFPCGTSGILMQHCRNWEFCSRAHQFPLKIKLVLKTNNSHIKILSNFVSKSLCSLHAAHNGGSHVVLKPGETSAQQASNVLCQIQTWFRTDADQGDALQNDFDFVSCTHGEI